MITPTLYKPYVNNISFQKPAQTYSKVYDNFATFENINIEEKIGVLDYFLHPILYFNYIRNLNSPDQKKQFMLLYLHANDQGKEDLKFIYKNGKLLSNDADDKSTTLQNLSRIVLKPRAKGLVNDEILNSALRSLANPYSITQDIGNITPSIAKRIMKDKRFFNIDSGTKILPAEYNVINSGTCVAASIEFNLADKRPSEFARYAADLTSTKLSVWEDFKFTDISESTLEAVNWLEKFNVEYESIDFEGGKILIKPDDAAIYRALSQTEDRAVNTRSALDTIIQSALMQLGSAGKYNSLSDVNNSDLNPAKGGLTELEKSMVEAIVDDKGGISSATYQVLDSKGFLIGYNKTHDKILEDILKSLKLGDNVIAGITEANADAKIYTDGGHEITIVAPKNGKTGKLFFLCNDTDDNISQPIELSAEELIPKIHHAGIPNVVLKDSSPSLFDKQIYIQIPPVITDANKSNQKAVLKKLESLSQSPSVNLLV